MISALEGTQPTPYVVVDRQSVSDIINSIVTKHKECVTDYDRIAKYFDTGDLYAICEGLWYFCKNNLPYKEEKEAKQYVSCPYTILTASSVDCKNNALFIAGVLDAIKRRGRRFTWKFRFTSYEIFQPTPGHVFVVVNENTDDIWIDPVLDSFNQHLYYWYKRDRRPTVIGSIGKIAGLPSIGNAAGDQLQNQLIEYTEGVMEAYNLSVQTNSVNTITQGVLQTASLAVPAVAAAMVVLKQVQPLLNDAFGVGSAAARVFSDLTSLNVVGLFNDLFNGRTYQYQIYWLAAMYQYYVLGKANITNQNQMTDKDVWPAVKWFIDRTGVYMSGTQTLQALVNGNYADLHRVNAGITTDPARVAAAERVAQTYWTGVPIDPGSSSNFLPGRAGSWANTIGVFDLGIAQIAQQYGLTPEQYVAQTGIDYTQDPTGSGNYSSSQLIPGVDNVWLIAAGFGALILIELIGD